MRWTRQNPARLPNSNIDSVLRFRRPPSAARRPPRAGTPRRPGRPRVASLAALLVVEDEAERDAGAVRPPRIRRLLAVADEVAPSRSTATSPKTPASASSRTRSGAVAAQLDEHLLGVLAAERAARGGRSSVASPSARRSGEAICRTRAERRMLALDDVPARQRLRVVERLLRPCSPATRDPGVAEQLEPLRRPSAPRTPPRGSARARRGARRAPPSSRSAGPRPAPGRPITSHSRSQNSCLATPTTIHPSAAPKFWKGTIDGWAEFGRRGGRSPASRPTCRRT